MHKKNTLVVGLTCHCVLTISLGSTLVILSNKSQTAAVSLGATNLSVPEELLRMGKAMEAPFESLAFPRKVCGLPQRGPPQRFLLFSILGVFKMSTKKQVFVLSLLCSRCPC